MVEYRAQLTNKSATVATALGVFLLSCFLVGVWGFLDGIGPGHRNKDIGLIIFNWLLIASSELESSAPKEGGRADLYSGRQWL